MKKLVNKKRLLATFLELVKIDSESFAEKDVAVKLEAEFKKLGAKVEFDDAHKKTGGPVGNLIARFPGTVKKPPFLLSSHMDTVKPGKGIKPKHTNGKITSDGTTILGSDCKSGISAILEALKVVKENNLPCPPVEAVLTVSEEVGILGSRNLDYKKIKAREGMVLDGQTPHELTVKAPSSISLKVIIKGKGAHSGMNPEAGISAIQTAAKGIAEMKLGRIDFETTANIGIIQGGRARNIVPEEVSLIGEARSHNSKKLLAQVKHMRQCLEKAVSGAVITVNEKKFKASMDFVALEEYPAMNIPPEEGIVKFVLNAAKEEGLAIETVAGGGGSDANNFNKHGIKCPNLGCGMNKAHTLDEFLNIGHMEETVAVVLRTLANKAK
ncbi:MAG: M20/M25/M40 family metallo-hydrolase [Elusimicrobiaceae bacterium]